MSKTYKAKTDFITLRNSATAITATTAGTELVSARIAGCVAGMALITVMALDIASADETYVITIEGRDGAAGAYTVLGTLTLTAALASVAGVYAVNIDRFKQGIRVNATLGGTTPSLTYTAVALGFESQYLPTPGTAITT